MRTDWIEVGYKELVEKVSTVKNKLKQKDYSDSGKFPVVDQGKELIGGYTDSEDLVLNCNLPVIVFGDHTKAVKLINFRFVPGADGTKVLIPKPSINPTFLAFNTKILTQKIEDKGYARHYQQVENKTLFLPPLPEQRAIVARIEELFCELDHAVSSLQSAQAKLDIYRQAVLKKAFEGGFKSSQMDSWKIWKTKEVCQNIKVGIVIQPSKFYSDDENGIKAFRSANVREFKINDSNWVYFSESGNQTNYRTQLKEGDVLIVRSGYPGTSCVVPKKYEGCNAIDILIATPNKDLILPEYLCAFNNSPMAKGLFEDGARGVAQKHLNVGVYSNLELPVPSIKEQKFILEEIESRLSVADKLAETIQTNLQKSEALRQSILKKAFEGRLLSEAEVEACRKEADWEPAERLLERIKQEKSKPKKS